LGFWVYFLLAFVFTIDIFGLRYIIIGEFLTGAVTTFIVWLIGLGWDSEFREIRFE
jgi:hypothetical protein